MRFFAELAATVENSFKNSNYGEVERLVAESVIDGNPQRIEDFKRNYLLRTGNQKKKG